LAFSPGRGFLRSRFWCVGALVAVIGLSTVLRCPAAAEVAVTYADTLLVTAGVAAGPAAPTTANLVTRIDLSSDSGFSDLTELLGNMAGLQMARLGGWGASAVPSLRGSSPAQIRFFVDGMPLPAAQTGVAAFARVPLDRLEAVEVYRGGVPTGLGGVGGIGAINFITRRDEAGLAAAAAVGSFGEWNGQLTVGSASNDNTRAGLFMVHGHRADNDFSFVDHNQTFHRTDDDTVRVRENAWIREWGAWTSGRWQAGALAARGNLGYVRRDGGRPGPLGYPSPNTSVRYERLDGQLHLDWSDGLLKVDAAVGRNHEYLYHPVAGEVGFRPPGTTRTESDDLYSRLVWSPVLADGLLKLDTGFDWRGQWQTETIVAAVEPERSRRATSAFVALTADLAGARLRLTPAWHWQHNRDNFPQTVFPGPRVDSENQRDDSSPSLGAVWTMAPGRLFAEGHIARTVRVPTWVELFGHRGGVDGNPTLQPEEITAADLAISAHQMGPATGRVAVFLAETDDKIIFVQNSQRTSKAMNLGRTIAHGVELELTAKLSPHLDFSGNMTVQRVTDSGEDPAYHGRSLPFLPDVEAQTRLGGRAGDWRPWLETGYMSANYRDRANTELDKAPARTRWNLGCSRDWYPDWLGADGILSVTGEVINLTDNRIYDVEGFPLPGRTWHLAVKVRR